MKRLASRLVQDTTGATAVEYGLMIALIALTIIVAVTLLGENVRGLFEKDDLNGALK